MTTAPHVGQALPVVGGPSSDGAPLALAEVSRAARSFWDAGHVEVGPVLAAYRRLAPVAHRGAASDAVDLAFLGAVASLGGALLSAALVRVGASVPRAPPIVVDVPGETMLRVAPGLDGAADAFALMLGVALEAHKLMSALDVGGDPLAAAAASAGLSLDSASASLGLPVDEARALLRSLVEAGPARQLARDPSSGSPPLDEVLFDLALDDGPLFVVAGATERLHDLVSPWVRRLEAPLARLARSRDADELYGAIPLVVAAEPLAHDERLDVETREGLTATGAAVVVRFDALDATRADARARACLRALKAKRARAVLCDRDPASLRRVLERAGKRARVVVVLSESLGAAAPYPDVVLDPISGHPLDVDNALGGGDEGGDVASVCLSPPSLGLTPAALLEQGGSSAPLLAPLLLEASYARARGHLGRRCRLAAGTFVAGDTSAASAVALRCLERMSGGSLPRRGTASKP